MVGVIGDLVEDIVVRVAGPLNVASDTSATIMRRRGGSAANVAVSVVAIGGRARFIGRVGDDPVGSALIDEMISGGVDVRVQRGGRSGTIVVIVGPDGERTMFPDRGACAELDAPDRAWLDGLAALHVPLYSLLGDGTTPSTTHALIGDAHDRGLLVTIDASSAGLIAGVGLAAVLEVLRAARPAILFANADEATVLGIAAPPVGVDVMIVKRGADPASVITADSTVDVSAIPLSAVVDTTGAGDAFAAAFLVNYLRAYDLNGATIAAHAGAADLLRSRKAPRADPLGP